MSNATQHTKRVMASSFTMSMFLVLTLATPANASMIPGEGERLVLTNQGNVIAGQPEYADNTPTQLQTLTAAPVDTSAEDAKIAELNSVEVGFSEEYLAELKKKEEEEAAKAAAEAEAAAEASRQNQQSSSNENSYTGPAINVPVSERAAALVNAARAQIGVSQDCTDLVQNALAAIGMTERRDRGGYDEGPTSFGKYGTVINPADARPGDILSRPGHVAIYTGDGVNHSAVHGGWTGFTTVESPYESNPSSYTVIRIG